MNSSLFFRVSVFLLFFVGLTACSRVISPEEAANHVGENVTVEGKVFSVYISRKDNSFLNFGGVYPKQVFMAVILARSGSEIDVRKYDQKRVSISGLVQLYKGKPEIMVKSENQIKIMP